VNYLTLGRAGLQISRLCIGTLNFGPIISETESHRLLDLARDEGVNFIDTSNSYGRHTGRGRAEEILGTWFTKGDTRRERTVLATKVYVAMDDRPNSGGLSALNIRRALDASLRRLKTDYVDLYQFHHVDRNTSWDEIWQAGELAIDQGKVLYFGSSNFAGWHIAQAQEAAACRHLLGLVSEQSIYNLLTRDVEREVLPAVEAYGLGFLAWSPLHEGALAGIGSADGSGVRRSAGRASVAIATHEQKLREYERLAARLEVSAAELALAWLLHRPGVTAPVVGPRTPEQLTSAIRATEITLATDALAELETLFPGHRAAPEDYAW
jgi:aryl-alcohol dehydrogenase-like predicted oxidoreductase